MATRTISTRLAIEGESEYRASITSINAKIKEMQSALKLTESQFQNNANSMTALTAKGEALSNLYDSQKKKVSELKAALENARQAQADLAKEKLQEQIDKNNAALEKMRSTTADTSKEEAALTWENEQLNDKLKNNEAYVAAIERAIVSYSTQLNRAEIALNETGAAIQLNVEYQNEARKSADGCATSIDRFGERMKESAGKANELRDALAAAGVIAALKKTADAFEECAKSSISYEETMAGVRRTVGGTDEFINDLADSFKTLSTQMPITANELSSIATTAGQLGVEQKNVEQFTTIMAKLATTTDLTADSAATLLAQFSNITGVKDYDRLGSTVAELGDATATTASKVVEMSQGMAAAANIAGMSATDIMAISAAVGSLGIESQAGSTAMSTLISTLYKAVETGDRLSDFASVAGMSADQFKKAWGENAAGALDSFIQGLTNTERNGKSAIVVLNDLGITNVRQTKAILGLASAGDLLSGTLKQASDAWEKNTTLGEKAEIMYGTTQAKLTMLANSFDNVKISIGDKLTPAISNLAEIGTEAFSWLADAIDGNNILVPIILTAATGIGTYAVALAGYTIATKVAAAATAAFTAAMKLNPIFLAISAIAALTVGIVALTSAIDDGVPSVSELTQYVDDFRAAMEEAEQTHKDTVTSVNATSDIVSDYIDRLSELEKQTGMTAAEQQEYKMTVDLLRQALPELNIELDEQTGLIKDGAESLRQYAEEWKKAALAAAIQTKYNKEIEAWGEAQLKVYEQQLKLKSIQEENSRLQEKADQLAYEAAKALGFEADSYEELVRISKQFINTADETTNLNREQVRSYQELTAQIDTNNITVNRLTQSIEEGNKALDENSDKVSTAYGALDELEKKQREEEKAIQDQIDARRAEMDATERVAENISDLAAQYDKSKESAEKSIESQVGLFGKLEKKTDKTVNSTKKMMKSWEDQAKSVAEYTENLRKAAEYGIDEGLVKSLSDGSAESAGYLSTIIKDVEKAGAAVGEDLPVKTRKFVNEFNESFRSTEEARTAFSETASAIENDYGGLREVLTGDARSVGSDIAEGIAGGIEQSSDAVAAATENAVDDATGKVYTVEKFHKFGQQLGEDVAAGVEEGKDDVTTASQGLGDEAADTMSQSGKDAAKAWDQGFQEITKSTQSRIDEVKAVISSSAPILRQGTYNVGRGMIDGMISGLDDRKSALFNKINSIVNTSISRAQSAAGVHSPSTKTKWIFEMVGEGAIVGIENKRRAVIEHTRSVVDEALSLDALNQSRATAASSAAISALQYDRAEAQAARAQQVTIIDTAAITAAVERGMRNASVTVDFDYRGFSDGKRKYEQ